jgi:CRISPR-associated protein Cmr4
VSAKVESKRCYFMTLDPIHIGTGDYRLGRVDNTIVRESGSNLPKIPGTSLCGAARSYAAHAYGCPEAAGRQLEMSDGQKQDNDIVKVFGAAMNTGGGQAGMVSISDARILFFPVYSMIGPIWITTREILKELSFPFDDTKFGKGEALVSSDLGLKIKQINLGWLLLKIKASCVVNPPTDWPNSQEWEMIKGQIVIVDNNLFSQIVNSNLEVRTSVSISPITGAAEDGALFTYEAIPRATWLWTELIVHPYVRELRLKVDFPLQVVQTGLKMIEYFGVGGMVTRGFGRMRLLEEGGATNGQS